jgi:hypothetical protein
MIGSDLFTIHQYDIPKWNYNQPVYLIPFGDIHRSAPMCNVEKWKEFLAWAKTKPNAYFLGMGDYDDLLSTSERTLISRQAGVHVSTIETLEDLFVDFTLGLCDDLEFMRGRLVGLIEGHHYAKLQDGRTTTQLMCGKLGCKYLGVSTFIRLSFRNNSKSMAIDIWAHHGVGNSRFLGGSLKRERKVLVGRTGSFLKGYEPEKHSYVAERAFSPTDMGVIKIEMTPRRKRNRDMDISYIDIHASI